MLCKIFSSVQSVFGCDRKRTSLRSQTKIDWTQKRKISCRLSMKEQKANRSVCTLPWKQEKEGRPQYAISTCGVKSTKDTIEPVLRRQKSKDTRPLSKKLTRNLDDLERQNAQRVVQCARIKKKIRKSNRNFYIKWNGKIERNPVPG